MEILKAYYNKHSLHIPYVAEAPEKGLKWVVCIPVYNEPDVLNTLESLLNCQSPTHPVEVLLLINDHEQSSAGVKKQNQKTFLLLTTWIAEHRKSWVQFHLFYQFLMPQKHAGVGLARKLLMDEAIHRFIVAGEPEGFILSLDADSLVAPEYFTQIEEHLKQFPKTHAVTFSFEHRFDAVQEDSNTKAIILYELHLRYFKQALEATGFPYSFYTIGSCFAVSASTYAKQGGMNRRQAGEDFYFLHKIFPLGNCYELPLTIVFPSARISDRVPFGTGPAIAKIVNEGTYLTYRPESFVVLKQFFSLIPRFFHTGNEDWIPLLSAVPNEIRAFFGDDVLLKQLQSIKQNTASEKNFIHRFFTWFDAFQIIKFLNNYHQKHPKIPVKEAVGEFLEMKFSK